MNISKNVFATVSLCLLGGFSALNAQNNQDPNQNAQQDAVNATWKPSLVKDGVIDAVPHVNRALEYNNIREIDAAWKRRVWRVIDVRQKQNQAFIYQGDEYTGGGAFIEILIDAVKKGKVSAYSMLDDRFSTPLNMESFEKTMGGTYDTIQVDDLETGELVTKIVKREFNVNTVTKYRIKEDWVFDRNMGRPVVRIVGIAPLKDEYNENTGDFLYSAPLFWLNYDELRKTLAGYEVYNPKNDLHRMSWSDYLDGRYFSSYVIKTSANNPTGANFESNTLRGLEDGERAMEAIRSMEDDMWQR